MRIRIQVAAVAATALATVSAPAIAQVQTDGAAAEDRTAAPDEIIVTAQKRAERLSDVPISITALSGDQLVAAGVRTPADLAQVTPGLTYQRSQFGVPIFTIRGVGLYDYSIATAPAVSLYVDQVPLPFPSMTQAAGLDVERVEVLKGPQGILFGQNSTGGAINYIAAKPADSFEAGLNMSYGRFNDVEVGGFVSGPLSSTVRARLYVNRQSRDGWQYSETRPNERFGLRNFTAARGLIDWEPSDTLKIELNVNGWVDRSQTQASQFLAFRPANPAGFPESRIALAGRAPAPNDARPADWDSGVDYRRDDYMYQGSLRADYQLGDNSSITSITAFSRFHQQAPTDIDGTDYTVLTNNVVGDIRSFFQEVRLDHDFEVAKLTFGVNYQRDKTEETLNSTGRGSLSGLGAFRYYLFRQIANQQTRTYSGFANLDLPLTSQLTFQAGARYTRQNRNFQGCMADGGDGALGTGFQVLTGRIVGPGACVTINTDTGLQDGLIRKSLDQDNLSWRASLNYRPSRDLLLYANVTKGYKSGAFTPLPAVRSVQLTPVVQESVLAFEAGAKASLLDRAVDLTAAAFYYDYRDKQVLGKRLFPVFGTLSALQNIPRSSVRGAEIEITARPVRGLRLTGGVTYVDSQVDESILSFDLLGKAIDIKGEAFPNTPKWQVVGDAEYGVAVSAGLKAFVGGNATYRSSSFAAFGENPISRFRDYALLGLRAGVSDADDKWRLEIWGRNVTNTFYWTNVSYHIDAIARTTGMPATYGVSFSSRF